MDIFKKYQYEFNELVNIIYCTHQGKVLFSDLWYVNALHKSLKKLYTKPHSQLPLLLEDIEQEVRVLWLEISKLWSENRPPVSLKTYLLRRSVWALRDWVNKEIRFITQDLDYPQDTDLIIQIIKKEKTEKFKLDIGFLLFGCAFYPICDLSPYERYLILLNFKEEKNILEMAKIVQKDRGLVGRQLKATIEKLRRLANGSKNTIRHSGTRPGSKSSGSY